MKGLSGKTRNHAMLCLKSEPRSPPSSHKKSMKVKHDLFLNRINRIDVDLSLSWKKNEPEPQMYVSYVLTSKNDVAKQMQKVISEPKNNQIKTVSKPLKTSSTKTTKCNNARFVPTHRLNIEYNIEFEKCHS